MPERTAPSPWEPERWEREGEGSRPASSGTSKPTRAKTRPPRRSRGGSSGEVAVEALRAELSAAVGRRAASAMEGRVSDGLAAFDAGRWADVWRAIKPVTEAAPSAATLRELAGVSLYRLGRWRLAATQLDAYRIASGSTERNPVLADCYRALKRYRLVAELWEELREASPRADIVIEGRIVAAGALADQGKLANAVALLEAGPIRARGAPKEHHLRLWYALADLYERAGDSAQAREMFARVAAVAPDLADTAERLHSLN